MEEIKINEFNNEGIYITPRIIITIYKGHLPVAWGHLEPGDGKTWLGVCVASGYERNGYGSKVVRKLCKFADNSGWDIWLSCKDELVSWYIKFGFVLFEKKTVNFMKRESKKHGRN